MYLNDASINLIKEFEGLHPVPDVAQKALNNPSEPLLPAYRDVAGYWTIGYGHAETSGMEPIPDDGLLISANQATEILRRDLKVFAAGVRDLIKVPLTPNQFGAVVSLAYNIGLGAFKKSTCLKRLNAGNIEGAAEALTWFNKAGGERLRGLVRRREAERALMLSDDMVLPSTTVTGGEQKPMAQSKTNWLGGGVVAMAVAEVANIRAALPELAPYLPWVFVAIGALIILNRVKESLDGEH